MNHKALMEAMYKKAIGYEYTECVSEYQFVDGEMTEVKRRESVKENPPDVSAAKLLLKEVNEREEVLNAEELKREKMRLIKLLLEESNAADGN